MRLNKGSWLTLALMAGVLATVSQAQAAFRQVVGFESIAPAGGSTVVNAPIYYTGLAVTAYGSTIYSATFSDVNLYTHTSDFAVAPGGSSNTISLWNGYTQGFDMISFQAAPAHPSTTLSFDIVGIHQDGSTVSQHFSGFNTGSYATINLSSAWTNLKRFDVVASGSVDGAFDNLTIAPHGDIVPGIISTPLPAAAGLALPLLGGLGLAARFRRRRA